MASRWRVGRWRSPLRAVIVCGVLALGFWSYAKFGDAFDYAGSPVWHLLAPRLDLTTDRGQQFSLGQLRGHAVLVYFGYTNCPDVCPATLADLTAALRELGKVSTKVDVVFVTLDPAHDSPPLLRHYLAAFGPRFIGLTGSPAAIAEAAKSWNISWKIVPGHADYIDHTSVVALVGPQGHLRTRYGVAQVGDRDGLSKDIRHVLDVS
ncbi:SCO family protein [Acidiphilium acidophilum]|uniref:SCO family protein n=1 Tax=Acidiphilium acidophilum TaxID=76588 RepID=UPI002E8E771D|nr:SCO family protein [Acidiphilium acidophilum]